MARVPPAAGYWITCLHCASPKNHTDKCEYLGCYHTSGTLKGFKYIHWSWGNGWNPLTWTCFPWEEFNKGSIEYYATLQDLEKALGTHRFKSAIHKLQTKS